MKATNSAANLYDAIGGLAAHQALRIRLGWEPDRKPTPKNNPAGSKLARQIKRGNKGLTCRNGSPINQKAA
jgi:hypothetical protein